MLTGNYKRGNELLARQHPIGMEDRDVSLARPQSARPALGVGQGEMAVPRESAPNTLGVPVS